MGRNRSGLFVAVFVVVVIVGGHGCRSNKKTEHQETASPSPSPPGYVGAESCAGCHAQAADAWRSSHHAQAMQPANASTVLGNFRDARFAKDQVGSSFYKKGDKFYVRTDGPDGKLADYPIAYTFGVFPLQQYLVPFPNGRFQSLVLAWDSRTKEQGGQSGSIYIRTKRCLTRIRCIGQGRTRRGTTCVPTVIRPTCVETIIRRTTATPLHGRRSMSRVSPVTDPGRTM